MFDSVRMRLGAAAIVACFFAAPTWGATVSVLSEAPTAGTPVEIKVDDFERVGNCGGGASVINDGCSVVVKNDPTASHAYGRFDPLGDYWIDSADIDLLKWTIASPVAFNTLTFALTDAHDQRNSHFTMSLWDGDDWLQIWEIATQKANRNLYWLSISFDAPVTMAELLFSTKDTPGYDGYGISAVSIAPIPLPSAALLLLSGAAAFAGLRRRRKAA